MAFHDVRLPEQVEQGATGGPSFYTTINPMVSGNEQRNINWSDARADWELSYGIQDYDDFDEVRQFFYARRGQAHSFRFKDWGDYKLIAEVIAAGDGSTVQFQVTKTYEDSGPSPYVRKITRPVSTTLIAFVNGVQTSCTLNPLGIIVFATAPANGAVIAVSCEFDVPVRFNVDKFALQLSTPEAAAIGSLPIIEVRE